MRLAERIKQLEAEVEQLELEVAMWKNANGMKAGMIRKLRRKLEGQNPGVANNSQQQSNEIKDLEK